MDGSWLAAGAPDRAVVLPGSVPSCPTYPPTPAPTAAPTGPPTTAPATPPVVAPMAVPFSVRLMPEQPANSATIAIAVTPRMMAGVFMMLASMTVSRRVLREQPRHTPMYRIARSAWCQSDARTFARRTRDAARVSRSRLATGHAVDSTDPQEADLAELHRDPAMV